MNSEAKLAKEILDLVSYFFTHQGKEYREGHDTWMEGVDEEAIEIIKKWIKNKNGNRQ